MEAWIKKSTVCKNSMTARIKTTKLVNETITNARK